MQLFDLTTVKFRRIKAATTHADQVWPDIVASLFRCLAKRTPLFFSQLVAGSSKKTKKCFVKRSIDIRERKNIVMIPA